MRTVILLALVSTLATACQNSCQQVCVRMADYAEECGLTVSGGELAECIEEQSDVEREDIQVCQNFGELVTIRSEWSCDDMTSYWPAVP